MAGAPNLPGLDKRAALNQAYQPIIRGYLLVAGLYYAAMIPAHFASESGAAQATMLTTSLCASLVAGRCWALLAKKQTSGRVELMLAAMNAMVLINILAALSFEYSQAKLMYFFMAAMIFAFASVSIRQAGVSIVCALGGLSFEVMRHAPDQVEIYGFVGFAAALSAISIAHYLRRAIWVAVVQRFHADHARRQVERRLASAEQLGETMRQQSLSDSLTGLPNRRAFFETLKAWRSEESGGLLWLILLDLDGFKAVNDNFGHMIGDELLKAVARRLRDHCASDAHVSRMGGDEFSIINRTAKSRAEVETWCQALLARLADVYLIEDRLVQISGSIGCYRVAAQEAETKSLQLADFALLHAKKTGKNRVVVFKAEHAKEAAERLRIEQALRVADLGKEIELLFQPQFDLSEDRIVSAEALARWNSPSIGRIAPDRFIKIAEESGLIANITIVVVAKALAEIERWQEPIPISINLSAHDLISDQIVSQIIELVRANGIAPALVEFEVTETAMMSDRRRATANLLRLANLGHPIALDDFGTGYSNFTYLRNLPIRKIKVDRGFMEDIGDPMTEKILFSLAGMARTLNMHCLFEGVETELELLMAKRVGAQSVQGYLFGKPMTGQALRTRLETPAPTRARA